MELVTPCVCVSAVVRFRSLAHEAKHETKINVSLRPHTPPQYHFVVGSLVVYLTKL